MVRVKPFAAIRPPKNLVTEVAAPPYDVLNSEEALAMAGEKSLLHITKPEIDFNPIADEHEQRTYDKAVENFKLWKERGWLVREEKEKYYVYAQTMGTRTQYGIVLCAHTDDYEKGIIKKRGKPTATCVDRCETALAMATASGGTRRRGSGLPNL